MAGVNSGNEPGFQVAPMVDVLLVLLVFFMAITSAQVLKVDKTIKLPTASHAEKKKNTQPEIVVNVRWDAVKKAPRFIMDDQGYTSVEAISPALKTARKNVRVGASATKNSSPRLVIRADRGTELSYIGQLMEAGGEAGLTNIAFSAVNKN